MLFLSHLLRGGPHDIPNINLHYLVIYCLSGFSTVNLMIIPFCILFAETKSLRLVSKRREGGNSPSPPGGASVITIGLFFGILL